MSLLKLITNVLPKTCTRQKRSYFNSLAQLSHVKVTLCGAGGQIGQPLSLLLKQSPFVDELALYDSQEINGLAMELGHVDTKCVVNAYNANNCAEAFDKANIVVIVSGLHAVGKKALESVYSKNAVIVQQIISQVAKMCPQALIAIGTNPVECLVPVASERLKFAGVYNPNHIFGITTLNVIRANTFAANILGLEPECVMVPVVGGNCDGTIVPLLTHALPCSEFTDIEIENITKSLQTAHYVVENLRNTRGPTLANAFAMARFVVSLIKGLKGYPDILEYAFIRTNDVDGLKYFGVPIYLGTDGVTKNLPLPALSNYENCLIEEAKPIVKAWIKKGNEFVGKIDMSLCDPCARNKKVECPTDCCDVKDKYRS